MTPHTVEPQPSFKINSIVMARDSINSAFDDQLSRDNEFESSYRHKHNSGNVAAATGKESATRVGQDNSMTMLKNPLNDGLSFN